jgi:uncharacterized delta-60 repeat protein
MALKPPAATIESYNWGGGLTPYFLRLTREGWTVMRKTVLLLASIALALLLASGIAWAAAGQLDWSFGGDGKVTTSFGYQFQYLTSMVRQPDGKLIAGGSSYWEDLDYNSHHNALLARYNRDGSLDKSFGTRGRVRIEDTALSDLALLEDGRIVASGRVDGSGELVLMRFNPDGTRDSGFGDGDGLVEVPGGAPLEIQPDGKIILAYRGGGDLGVARFNPDGSPDLEFGGGDGVATANAREAGGFSSLAVTDLRYSDGKITVVGTAYHYPEEFSVVARYNADGTLDKRLGGDGIVLDGETSGYDAAAVMDNGKIVAVGSAYNRATRSVGFVVARYVADGTIDERFGGDGKVVTSMGKRSTSYINDLELQRDGKIVAAGYSYDARKVLVVRYNPDGSLNKKFGGDGKVLTGDGDPYTEETADEVLVQPNGRIAAAGSAIDGEDAAKFFLVRYLGK